MRAILRSDRLKFCIRLVLPVLVSAICLSALSQHVSSAIWQTLPDAMAQLPLLTWVLAAAFTGLSFYAIGRYDGVAHTHLQTGIPQVQARSSGTIAIAVAQTLGFGLFTGALVRWRLLPSLSLSRALTLSAFVSVSFILGWMIVTALASLLLPAPTWTFWPSLVTVLAMPVFAFVMFRWPTLQVGTVKLHLPSLQMSGSILLWSMVDLCAAGTALWVLLPSEAHISLLAFLPIYMLALGTALISNTPGGVGPFELVLIASLPNVAPDALMVSVIAFRLVFYALPACIGAICLIRPFAQHMDQGRHPVPAMVLREAPRSETSVILQNGGYLERTRTGVFAAWATGQTLTALFDPVRGLPADTLNRLSTSARQLGRLPLFYKCSPRAAIAARRMGWSVLHVTDDALIDTQTYSLDTPRRRTLRRKIRAVEKAGVQIVSIASVPQDALAKVDASWCARLGPARGGTMGRFCPQYLNYQFALAAKVDGEIVAFVSFFRSQNEWALDLMRQTPNAPTGVMHALVHASIEVAKTRGVPAVSLAATPACPDASSPIWRAISMQIVERAGGPGLRQFKSAFAPTWHPRYAAAQGPFRLAIGLADIAREVHNPRPIQGPTLNAPHDLHENYELDSRRHA